MSVKQRLIEFIKVLEIGQGAFEKEVGLSNGYVNNIRQSIQPDKLQRIALKYPQLNSGWLMTGEGEMLRNYQNLENVSNSVAIGRDANGSEIHVTSQNVEEFIRITEKYQEHTDKMLAIIEQLINK
jgi:hypothetical protein